MTEEGGALLKASIIVHGGAGGGKYGRSDRRFSELRRALEEGMTAMRGGSSLDGVQAAVEHMEGCGAFNAGKGACLTAAGTVQLDAAIMEGGRMRGAGVGAVTCTYNPVRLARWAMENTPHVLLVGEGCKALARAAGMSLESVSPSKNAEDRFRELRAGGAANLDLWATIGGGTVGAVAIDSAGTPSAAVSTGGVWMKLPGRVGDSAIIGAGVCADKSGAACATGSGEEIIRNVLAWDCCQRMAGCTATAAARRAIATMSRRSGRGTAGIITVDSKGRVGYAYNTEAMGRAWCGRDGRVRVEV
jgi:L-asparaginase / beta-aspartyl-peptidase